MRILNSDRNEFQVSHLLARQYFLHWRCMGGKWVSWVFWTAF